MTSIILERRVDLEYREAMRRVVDAARGMRQVLKQMTEPCLGDSIYDEVAVYELVGAVDDFNDAEAALRRLAAIRSLVQALDEMSLALEQDGRPDLSARIDEATSALVEMDTDPVVRLLGVDVFREDLARALAAATPDSVVRASLDIAIGEIADISRAP